MRPGAMRPAVLLGLLLVAGGLPVPATVSGVEVTSTVAPGFQETIAISGLSNPTNVRFAADGRVFVAEKRGRIKVYDDLSDTTPTSFSDLTTNVHDFWDRGLLGMTLDPSLTGGVGTGPYVYVLYAYDHILGEVAAAPHWQPEDSCPTPPGSMSDGCVISGRLSRFEVSGSTIMAGEQVLVEDWCQQYPSHSLGGLQFGSDGSLYASAGEGAGFALTDYGQLGGKKVPIVTERNPCGDPPGGIGGAMTAPTAEGGSLRSQDIRGGSDSVGLSGSIIRINPETGAGMPGNPFASSTAENARRIIAYGLRNPFRFTMRPGTNELWLGDVGWNTWEEINRIPNATDNVAENFGWPCYEGAPRQSAWDAANLNLCEDLYDAGPGAVSAPWFGYDREHPLVPNESCPVGTASVTGLAFYPTTAGSYPAGYAGGLFFADHTRNCIWFMPKGSNGQPDPATAQVFVSDAAHPVDLVIGPGGDLFYVDFEGGTVRRVTATGGNIPPTAVLNASPLTGPTPLTVHFNSTGSFDAEATTLKFAWDLDGDGQLDDATSAAPQWTYTQAANVTVQLRVTDGANLSTTVTKTITVGHTPPVPVISTPTVGTTWKVGDPIAFSGSATDLQDGALPASALSWSLVMQHCPSICHEHTIQSWTGVAAGSFSAPDHEYPSYLELTLTATDSLGTQASVTRRLDPRTVTLTLASNPSTFSLAFDGGTAAATFTRTVIIGSANSVSAIAPQSYKGATWTFGYWSDGGAASHTIIAPATATTYTAKFRTTSTFFTPIADAQVRPSSPSRNYGHDAVLRVRLNKSRVYLKFTVTGLTGAPASAKLRLWVTDGGPAGGNIYTVSNSWTETGITWNNRPLISGTKKSTLGAVSTGTWVEFPLGNAITGNGTFSFAISGGTDNVVDYASRETSNDPYLVVTP
ncbi:MAG TPA: PQQ-dependent sugar dehydrogenase [Candidatus Limnocylindrales bacterium]